MKVVLSHFFNEALLLPYWLRHHREIFDHGVLIDYGSTDDSVAICKELAPEWEVIPSENAYFNAVMVDFEVMKHEQRFPGAWKMALNTTEFLVGGKIDSVIDRLKTDQLHGAYVSGAHMVDNEPGVPLDPSRPLVDQKRHGYSESEIPLKLAKSKLWLGVPTRNRLLHRHYIGAYTPGRHSTNHRFIGTVDPTDLAIWWYSYSPWQPEFVARKLQVQTKIDPIDIAVGFGVHHQTTEAELTERYQFQLGLSRDLTIGEPRRDPPPPPPPTIKRRVKRWLRQKVLSND